MPSQTVSGPQTAVTFGYNGLGDRLQQVSGGVTTRYALDLNNSISQVLSDGSSTYLYGLDRIAQQNIVGRQYYLGDALGSVRQIVKLAGTVIQARSYEPFGKSLSAAGNSLTKYGFTAEWTDPTNLIYLRARYYDPRRRAGGGGSLRLCASNPRRHGISHQVVHAIIIHYVRYSVSCVSRSLGCG